MNHQQNNVLIHNRKKMIVVLATPCTKGVALF